MLLAGLRRTVSVLSLVPPLTQLTRGVKTHSGAAKRWSETLKRGRAGHRHGLFGKSARKLNFLAGTTTVHKTQKRQLRRLLPGR
ncbi:hypothetical protein PYCC9005_003466 [Savitreella phatthalungensis]